MLCYWAPVNSNSIIYGHYIIKLFRNVSTITHRCGFCWVNLVSGIPTLSENSRILIYFWANLQDMVRLLALIWRFGVSSVFFFSGVWYCGHNWPTVPAPDYRWRWLWRNWWNEHWQGKLNYSKKTCPRATLSTTNPTWLDLGLNLSCRGKPAINCLSYGMALI
jgi:hypothetical protein